MTRVQHLMVLAMALVMVAAVNCAVQAQAPEGSRRGSGRGSTRGSLLGLLRLEQVQEEMNLSEEQKAKVREVVEKLGAEMREQYAALREIEDRQQRTEKTSALRDEFDGKIREQLRDVVEREQMMRLYQIRMQVRPVVESLSNRYVAGRLELTDQQKEKVADIAKDSQEKESEFYAKMRDAGDAERSEIFQKLRQIRSEADEKALGVLTDAQKAAFEEMKGEKVELEMRGRRRSSG